VEEEDRRDWGMVRERWGGVEVRAGGLCRVGNYILRDYLSC